MAPDYGWSKLYVIVNTVNDLQYVGSTTRPLARRMVEHRARAKEGAEGSDFPLYKAMREIGINRFSIELLEDVPCNRKEELNVLEGRAIRAMRTLVPNGYNAEITARTRTEYAVDNREENLRKKKVYDDANRAKLNEKASQYYYANHDAILAKEQVRRAAQRAAMTPEQRLANNQRHNEWYAARRAARRAEPAVAEPAVPVDAE